MSYLLDFAKALIAGEQMGRHDVTDVLTISISTTDILGHDVGPDSPEQRALISAVDVQLDSFFSWLDKNVDGGLDNVWVALTGDHGIAPIPAVAANLGMPAATFDLRKLVAALNERLNQKFSPGKQTKYMLSSSMPYLTLDPRPFQQSGISEAKAEEAVSEMIPEALDSTLPPEPAGVSQTRLPPRPMIRRSYTRVQMAAGQLPATEEGRLILHSYSPNDGWYVMISPGMYELTSSQGNKSLFAVLLRQARAAGVLRLAVYPRYVS